MNKSGSSQTLPFLTFTAAAFAGNYFKLPLFFNVDFLFGGIAVMLVLGLYGKGPAVISALLSSSCTYILWNHPYAIIIFTSEAIFVSLLYKKHDNIVVLDAVYWLLIGMPLVWLFYSRILGMDYNGAFLIMLKQSVNGIFNALAAGIAYQLILLHRHRAGKESVRPLTFQNILFYALTGLVLFSSLTFWVIEIERHKQENEKNIVQRVEQVSANIRDMLYKFTGNSPHNRAELQNALDIISAVTEKHTTIAVIGPDGNIIINAGDDLNKTGALGEDGYDKRPLDRGVFQLIPKPEKGKSIMQRWNRSFYIKRERLETASGTWTVIAGMSVAPQVHEMTVETIKTLSIVWILVMVCIAISTLISRMMSRPLLSLQNMAADIPTGIADGKKTEWTESSISEIRNLTQDFKKTAALLSEKFAELKEANAALKKEIERRRRVEKLVQHIGEREKQKLGQDLHDGLGQILTGIAFRSNALEQKLSEKALPEAQDAATITGLAGQATAYTKDMAKMLVPMELFENGFHAALDQLCTDAAKRFGVSCYVKCGDPMFLPDYETAGNLYRIAQEAITNAIKHGQAEEVEVELTVKDSNIIMIVRDNGSGLQKDWQDKRGLGLRIMKQRAKMIGAELNINRLQEKGTEVVCKVDLSARQENADE